MAEAAALINIKNKYKENLILLKQNKNIFCVNEIENIFTIFFSKINKKEYQVIKRDLDITSMWRQMSNFIYKISCYIASLIKYNKKVDLLSLEKSCLDILKSCTEDTITKKVNIISEKICDLFEIKGVDKSKIQLLFNPFCYNDLRNLVKEKCGIKFNKNKSIFYSIVNLNQLKEKLEKKTTILKSYQSKNISDNQNNNNEKYLDNIIHENIDDSSKIDVNKNVKNTENISSISTNNQNLEKEGINNNQNKEEQSTKNRVLPLIPSNSSDNYEIRIRNLENKIDILEIKVESLSSTVLQIQLRDYIIKLVNDFYNALFKQKLIIGQKEFANQIFEIKLNLENHYKKNKENKCEYELYKGLLEFFDNLSNIKNKGDSNAHPGYIPKMNIPPSISAKLKNNQNGFSCMEIILA